jgi:outer membrane immunogenic protein
MRMVLTVLVALLAPFVAYASDLAPAQYPSAVLKAGAAPGVAPFSWTGFYVGANAGYGVGSGEVDSTKKAGVSWQAPVTQGALGGIQAGYNFQYMRAVLGFETDFDLSGIDSKGGSNMGWLSTVRGRAGFIVTPSLLLYGTGGLAIDQANMSGGTTDTVKAGWVAGAGAEYMLTRQWSVKAEYLHYDVGSVSAPGLTTKVEGDAGRVGVNFKFGN